MIVDPWTAVAFLLVMLFSNGTVVIGDHNIVIVEDESANNIKTEP